MGDLTLKNLNTPIFPLIINELCVVYFPAWRIFTK